MRDVPEGPEHRCGHVHWPRQGEEQTLYTWFQSWSPVLMVFGAVQMKVWQQSMGSISTPENIPRLFDMVRVTDESVRPAFYFALRDTLVAADLEQATRVAFQKNKRWRVVTLQGQIIEQAGLFTAFTKCSFCFNAYIKCVMRSRSKGDAVSHLADAFIQSHLQMRTTAENGSIKTDPKLNAKTL